MDGKALSSALLRELRRQLGLSQRALAQTAGVPQPTIAEIEAVRREPTITLLSKIVESAGLAIEVRLVPLDPQSAVAAANKVKDRLTGSAGAGLPIAIREDGALRAVLDLKDALRRSDRDQFTVLVEFPPSLIGDTRWDAFMAAVVEDEAATKNLPPPRWTNDPSRFNKPFWYLSDNRELHTWELTTAPGAFVRHGVFAAKDELESV
jgi:transcriptional regulator with XRE-family HTH domain